MINIAIDGHAGSGKSTLAKAIAEKLKIKLFDTGAIYRGLACSFKESEFKELNADNVTKFIENVVVEIKFIDDKQHVIVNGTDWTPYLRKEEISTLASKIAVFPNLRRKMLQIQRDFASKNDCVMEGRDIGTEVLPNANVKIFVTAKPEVRAQRRFDQLVNKDDITFEKVLKDLIERDKIDETREISPLKPAKDSVLLDNSHLNLNETVDACIKIIKEKL